MKIKITMDHVRWTAKVVGAGLIGAACGLLLAHAAKADTFDNDVNFVSVKESVPLPGNWFMDEDMTVKGGQQIGVVCSGYALYRFKGQGKTFIKFTTMREFAGTTSLILQITREGWKTSPDRTYSVTFGIDKDTRRVARLTAKGTTLWGQQGVVIFWNTPESQGAVQELVARGSSMEFTINGKDVGSFNLSGSANMLTELNKCATGGESF